MLLSRSRHPGQTLTEYGAAIMLIIIGLVALILVFGNNLTNMYSNVGEAITSDTAPSTLPSATPTAPAGIIADVTPDVADIGTFTDNGDGTSTGTISWTIDFSGGVPDYDYVADFYKDGDLDGSDASDTPLTDGMSPLTLTHDVTCINNFPTTYSLDLTITDSAAHSVQFDGEDYDVVVTCVGSLHSDHDITCVTAWTGNRWTTTLDSEFTVATGDVFHIAWDADGNAGAYALSVQLRRHGVAAPWGDSDYDPNDNTTVKPWNSTNQTEGGGSWTPVEGPDTTVYQGHVLDVWCDAAGGFNQGSTTIIGHVYFTSGPTYDDLHQ